MPQAPELAKASELARPLNLRLSPEALRALPAASTPVLPSARLPLTVEQHLGKTLTAAGSAPWLQERLDAHRVRFRSGERCITYTRPQSADLFPFDDAAQRSPWTSPGVEQCSN